MSKCPFCGNNNPAGVELCKACGARIPDATALPDSPAQATPATDAEPTEAQPTDLENRVLEELLAGRKIAAVKLYREATGGGLKEAKDAVEDLGARHNVVAKGSGCAGALVLLLATSAGLWARLW